MRSSLFRDRSPRGVISMKEKLLKAGKILLIVGLLLAITVVAVLQWKSDFIIRKVLDGVQAQLTDSLTYSDVAVSAFSYFPCLGIQLDNARIGDSKTPLLSGERIDVVIALWPLLRDEIQVRKIHAYKTAFGIRYLDGKWSYDILKKEEDVDKAASTETGKSGWNTTIRSIVLDQCTIAYDDGKTQSLWLDVKSGSLEGNIGTSTIDADITLDGICNQYKSTAYELPEPVELQLSGHYLQDEASGKTELKDWDIKNDGIRLSLNGVFDEVDGITNIDLNGSWKDGNPEYLRRLVPAENRKSIEPYSLSGKSEGEFSYVGESSKSKEPTLQVKGRIDNAKLEHTASSKTSLDLDAAFAYHSKDPEHQHKSTLVLDLARKSMLGSDFKGNILIQNMDSPVYAIELKGGCPASLINLVMAPELTFDEGEFDVDHFSLKNFRTSGKMIDALFENLNCAFTPKGVKGTYVGKPVELDGGYCKANADGKIELALDNMQWENLNAKDVRGNCTHAGEILQFNIAGKSCGGEIETNGSVETTSQRNTFRADWKVKGIEMHTLLKSFNNFDQTFITSDNLNGKADIWAETMVPMTTSWEVKSKEIVTRSAIIIRDGRLKNLKTLEDFSKYIHLEALRDIEFNELRNYLKIEDGKVYMPVMFIQSTAINMSIAGVHAFDQSILYNIKLNAGQALANKMKKTDFRKDLKPARKSGWINMYFVLEGTTSNVKYQQYRTAVIAGFEQSAALKDQLRKHMVDRFGYDVYWIEPNEWEDIPEYK
jgi:hypothetical protein